MARCQLITRTSETLARAELFELIMKIMKNYLPIFLAVLFFIVYQLIMYFANIGENEFSILRSLSAGIICVFGYGLGKIINKKKQ